MTDPMSDDERVAAAQAAVRATAEGGPDFARAVDDLAEEWLRAGDIDLAIATRRMGLARLTDDRSFALALLDNLGVDLMSRYQRTHDPTDLRESCDIAETVFDAATDTDRLRAASHLAGRLSTRAARLDDQAELDRALRLITDELESAAPGDEWRSLAANTLAGVLLARWHRDGDLAALDAGLRVVMAEAPTAGGAAANVIGMLSEVAEETSDPALLATAEELGRQSLAAASAEYRATIARLVSTVLMLRAEWTSDPAALTEALRAADEAVRAAEAVPDDAELARALSMRSVVRAQFGRAQDDRTMARAAVADARDARAAADRAGEEPGEYANHLAMLLAERFDLLGDSDDLDEAIALLDAVLVGGVGADAFAAIATNLANALLSRADRDGSPAELDRAIELAEAAIDATAPHSAGLAARHDIAGRLRAYRDQPDDLALAEKHAEAAVRNTPPESADRALYLNNQAMWATRQWEAGGSADDLTRAIDLLERALAVSRSAQDDNSVLTATIRYNLGSRLQQLFELRLDAGHEDLAVLQHAADELDEVLGADHPHLTLVAGKRLGDIAWRLSLWKEGEHAFRLAMAAAGQLSGLRRHRQDKERARSGVQGIGALAALCAARNGDIPAAAAHLEQASATLIAEAVGVTADSVTFDGIVAGAGRMGRHVLLLGVTGGGGIGVLVGPDGGAAHQELSGLTEEALATRVREFRQIMLAAQTDPDADVHVALDELCRWTMETVLSPLTELLSGVRRLAILPLGRLAWLPLTTAGPPGRAAALAPFEPVLLVRATSTRQRRTPRAGGRRVLVWADTGPVGNPIPGAVREARRVAGRYPEAELRIHQRTPIEESTPPADDPDRVRALLDADILHLACHCEVDVDNPQETVLHVWPPIRIGVDLARGSAGQTHVVLSACDAALTGAALPDEALSAATAFLLAGAGAVLAPLWPVGDGLTPRFMADYHAELAADNDPPQALARVQATWAGRPRIAHAPWVLTAWPDALGTR